MVSKHISRPKTPYVPFNPNQLKTSKVTNHFPRSNTPYVPRQHASTTQNIQMKIEFEIPKLISIIRAFKTALITGKTRLLCLIIRMHIFYGFMLQNTHKSSSHISRPNTTYVPYNHNQLKTPQVDQRLGISLANLPQPYSLLGNETWLYANPHRVFIISLFLVDAIFSAHEFTVP